MNGAMFFIHVGSGASVGGVEEVLDCLAAGCPIYGTRVRFVSEYYRFMHGTSRKDATWRFE